MPLYSKPLANVERVSIAAAVKSVILCRTCFIRYLFFIVCILFCLLSMVYNYANLHSMLQIYNKVVVGEREFLIIFIFYDKLCFINNCIHLLGLSYGFFFLSLRLIRLKGLLCVLGF